MSSCAFKHVCMAYWLLVEGHAGQVLPEHLADHLHPFLTNVEVAVDLWSDAFSSWNHTESLQWQFWWTLWLQASNCASQCLSHLGFCQSPCGPGGGQAEMSSTGSKLLTPKLS